VYPVGAGCRDQGPVVPGFAATPAHIGFDALGSGASLPEETESLGTVFPGRTGTEDTRTVGGGIDLIPEGGAEITTLQSGHGKSQVGVGGPGIRLGAFQAGIGKPGSAHNGGSLKGDLLHEIAVEGHVKDLPGIYGHIRRLLLENDRFLGGLAPQVCGLDRQGVHARGDVLVAEFHERPPVILKGGHAADFGIVHQHGDRFEFDVVGDLQLHHDRGDQGVYLNGQALGGRFDGDDRRVLVGTRVKLGNGIDPLIAARGQNDGHREGQEIFHTFHIHHFSVFT